MLRIELYLRTLTNISLHSTRGRSIYIPEWGGCGPQRRQQGPDHHAPGAVLPEDLSEAEEDCCPQDHPDRPVPLGRWRDAGWPFGAVLPAEAGPGWSVCATQPHIPLPQPSVAPEAGVRQVGEQGIAYKTQTGASPQTPDLPRTGTGASLLATLLPMLALLLK